MLTNEQLKEIREHLERAQNPLFYYDNDADGLCSFVLLRKFIDRGKGVAVRSFPELNVSYARKAQELKADYIFILDKPIVSREFIEEITSFGLPIVWIDHHEIENEKFDSSVFQNLFIYNSMKGNLKSDEPTTYWCYKVSGRKEDIWLAVAGCIADHFIPDFVEAFEREYLSFWGEVKNPFDAFFGTEIGKIAMAFNFGVKDSTTNVIKLQNFLISIKHPREVFEEKSSNYSFRVKYAQLKSKYEELLGRAITFAEDKIVFFEYSGETSMSSELANWLCYRFPKKYIVVAYKNGAISNLSLRGKNVKRILTHILKKIEGTGGGHDDAVGARINVNELQKFREFFEAEIECENI